MKDLPKLILAGGFLSILFLYGGIADHGFMVDRDGGHQTASSVQQVSPAVQPVADRATADSMATTPTESMTVADTAETPEAAPEQTAQKAVSTVSRKPATTMRFVVYFDFDSAKISSRSKRTIQQAMAFAKSVEAKNVGLAGFADSAGPADYNMKLSERRAHVVAAALKTLDTGLEHLDVKAFGEERLAVATPDGLAEQRNRRVEIVITA